MQTYLNLVRKESDFPRERSILMATAVVAGLAMGASMAVVNAVAGDPQQGSNFRNLLLFAAFAGIYLFGRKFALIRTGRIVEAMIVRLRVRIAGKLRDIDLQALDRIGRQKIADTLSHDCFVISEASESMVNGLSAAVMLSFSAFYVATLSLLAFVLLCLLVVLAIVFYRRNQRSSRAVFDRAAESESKFFASLQHLQNGFREIKIAAEKGDDLYVNFLEPRANQARDQRLQSQVLFIRGLAMSQTFFYVLIASVIFILPEHGVSQQIIGKITYIILFIGAPIETLVQALPSGFKANVAAENLVRLEAQIDEAEREQHSRDHAELSGFKSIDLRDVCFRYPEHEDTQGFVVGPINLTIRPGEIIFIVGGNGSGKSTLMMLLLALFHPVSGTVLWDGVAVDRGNAAAYRRLFSVIFADFHLFDQLYGMRDVNVSKVAAFLKLMGLDRKVSFSDGAFSTRELSTGQRKRLAMVTALLEGKPICVFDEWAADQDSESRSAYYLDLLPGLKAKGQTIIAVTHDDRYFNVADHIIFMEEGRVRAMEKCA